LTAYEQKSLAAQPATRADARARAAKPQGVRRLQEAATLRDEEQSWPALHVGGQGWWCSVTMQCRMWSKLV